MKNGKEMDFCKKEKNQFFFDVVGSVAS